MLPKRDEVLAEMEDYATEHKIPIVGPAVARVLHQLALMIQRKQFSNWARRSAIRPSGGRRPWARRERHLHRRRFEESREGRGYFDRAGVSNESRCTPETRSNFSRSRNRSSTSSSTMSTKKIIRACLRWWRRACARADCSSPTTFYGADAWREESRQMRRPRPSWNSIASSTTRGVLHDDPADPRWTCGGDEEVAAHSKLSAPTSVKSQIL